MSYKRLMGLISALVLLMFLLLALTLFGFIGSALTALYLVGVFLMQLIKLLTASIKQCLKVI